MAWHRTLRCDCVSKTWLYCFETKDKKMIKVGYTWNLRLRKQRLQLDKKTTLVLFEAMPFSCFEEAFCCEQEILRRFQHLRIKPRGEWLVYNDEIKSYFSSLVG